MRASYPTYKSTSIPWLPEMPVHWDALKAKHIFKERSEKGYPDEPLLAATQTKGVVRKEEYENRTVTAQKDFHLLKLVKEEDFVISLRSFQGGIEYAYHRGIISPAYTIFHERNKVPVNKAFYRHLFKSHPFINSLTLFVTGIREGQNIDYAEFKDSLLPLPPLPEQTAIAKYLDAKTEQINRFIEKKEKLIALLKEQKQAVINNAITKGVNESATFQKTESVWFKEIPSHWKIVKFNHYVYLKHGFQFRDFDFKDEGIKVVKISQLKSDGSLDLSECSCIESNRLNEFKDIKISKGDILMALTGGTIGKIILVSDINETLLMNYRVGSFYPTKPKELSKEYLFHLLSSNIIFGQIMFAQRETGQPNIGKEDFRKMRFPMPPTISEQDEIVKYIKEQSKNIELIVNRVEREIEKVKELKQSLIAEVVTGKIKVA